MSLPDNVVDRDEAIAQAVLAGNVDMIWTPIVSSDGNNTLQLTVMADALKIDGVRVCASAKCEQRVADMLGAMLLTPKIADLIWAQRTVNLPPYPRPISSSTAAMEAHSAQIDNELAKLENPTGLISTVGKHWTVSNGLIDHPGMAENYGWHFVGKEYGGLTGEPTVSLPGVRLIQGRGWMHDMGHADYSQNIVLVMKTCLLNGQPYDLPTLLQDPNLASLANHDGVLKVLRQPGTVDLVETAANTGRGLIARAEPTGPDELVPTDNTPAVLATMAPVDDGFGGGYWAKAAGLFAIGAALGWIGSQVVMSQLPTLRRGLRRR